MQPYLAVQPFTIRIKMMAKLFNNKIEEVHVSAVAQYISLCYIPSNHVLWYLFN